MPFGTVDWTFHRMKTFKTDAERAQAKRALDQATKRAKKEKRKLQAGDAVTKKAFDSVALEIFESTSSFVDSVARYAVFPQACATALELEDMTKDSFNHSALGLMGGYPYRDRLACMCLLFQHRRS